MQKTPKNSTDLIFQKSAWSCIAPNAPNERACVEATVDFLFVLKNNKPPPPRIGESDPPLHSETPLGYQSEIARSKFCLCPLGWAPWSPRLVESVALGCVPVIIADGIRLPFPTAVSWADISLTVAENAVDRLGEVLEHVAATNLTAIQKNLWDPAVRRALLFNVPAVEGDATWQVMESLSRRLGRSRKRSSSASIL